MRRLQQEEMFINTNNARDFKSPYLKKVHSTCTNKISVIFIHYTQIAQECVFQCTYFHKMSTILLPRTLLLSNTLMNIINHGKFTSNALFELYDAEKNTCRDNHAWKWIDRFWITDEKAQLRCNKSILRSERWWIE